jgi:hypothetical protein
VEDLEEKKPEAKAGAKGEKTPGKPSKEQADKTKDYT